MQKNFSSVDKRSSPRAWFRQKPEVVVAYGDHVHTARCLNISTTGLALTFGFDVGQVKEGELIEAFMMSRRQQVMVEGAIVRTQSINGRTLVCITFSGEPEGLVELIELALLCLEEDFSAGTLQPNQETLKASGSLSCDMAKDVSAFVDRCRKIDLSDVRDVELVAASSKKSLRLLGCRPKVANLVLNTIGDTLCDENCKLQCSADEALSKTKTIH
jgi:PilZ domain